MKTLWTTWYKHYDSIGIDTNRICKDGIIDETLFAQAPLRVLFVLKEVNDWEGGDLGKMLSGGARYQMWHAAGRWAAGILHGFPSYDRIDNKETIDGALRRIAVVNLKKTSGKAISNPTILNAYALMDRGLLVEQISQIRPDIVLACGTFDPLAWLLRLKVDPDRPHEELLRDPNSNAVVVPWCHPGRVSNKKTYLQLATLLEGVVDSVIRQKRRS